MNIDFNEAPVAPLDGDRAFRAIGGMAASCFVGAFVTDIVYSFAPDMVWVTFSVWMITIGLIVAAIATGIGLIDRLVHRRFGALRARWPALVGFAVVVVVEIFNAFVHSRDAYQAVVPAGITLSAIAVVLLMLTLFFAPVATSYRTVKASS